MDSIKEQFALQALSNTLSPIAMEEVLQLPPMFQDQADTSNLEKGHTYSAPGGCLAAAFNFADSGTLHYTSDIAYSTTTENWNGDSVAADDDLANSIRALLHKELECHVCYNIMLDPTTTPCGHTFCRKCLARVLDHSSLCPFCRRQLFLPSSLARQPSNKYLVNLLEALCPEQVAARAEATALEEQSIEGLDTPLFICTLSYPKVRTYLHIFEPRYRLMVRRALETNRRFGMVNYNRYLEPQGQLGRTHFMEVGTMLQIEQCQVLQDGRSILECVGLYRFRVRAHGQVDGYMLGNVEKMEDLSLAEEESQEAQETTQNTSIVQGPDNFDSQLDRLPTSTLFQMSNGFIVRARERSARWFSNRVITSYGNPPDDPAIFPYWLAAVLPIISDEEKYKILLTTSIRERLKITARWVHMIESQRCPCKSRNIKKDANHFPLFEILTPNPLHPSDMPPKRTGGGNPAKGALAPSSSRAGGPARGGQDSSSMAFVRGAWRTVASPDNRTMVRAIGVFT
ncbi:MAG: hypothetical protein M1831_007387 [Alyxoria varia]|nr:MAG: hypothetical protein M1831_007387 [Alyxoria varia]